jgi:hypothetical protein
MPDQYAAFLSTDVWALARLPLFAAYFSKGPIILTRRLLILLESNS